jgi:AraC-like DNA-binding protein
MTAHIHRPGGQLTDFVDCLWLWEGSRPEPRARAIPSGTLDIVINLRHDRLGIHDGNDRGREPRHPGIVVCGAQARYFVIDTPPDALVMGVHFRPGGAHPFVGLPAGELEGAHVALDALWGRRAGALRERLIEAACHEDRFRLVEAALLAVAARPLRRHPAVEVALRAFEDPDLATVAEVNARTGLSAKQLLALFREEVGLGPKAFWRVRRFQAAIGHLEGARRWRGAELAARLGYFDQSHFIREFRALSGLTPHEYPAHGEERRHHVPLRG